MKGVWGCQVRGSRWCGCGSRKFLKHLGTMLLQCDAFGILEELWCHILRSDLQWAMLEWASMKVAEKIPSFPAGMGEIYTLCSFNPPLMAHTVKR